MANTSTPTKTKKAKAPRKTLAEIRQEREAFDAARLKQKRIRQGVLFCFVALAVLGLLYLLAQRPARFSGQILDAATQEVLRTGTIRLDQQEPQAINDVTATFLFQNIKAGKHKIVIESGGYLPLSQTIEFKAGQNQISTFKLQALPEAKLSGDMWVVVSQNPDQVRFLDADFKEVKRLTIKAKASAAAVSGKTLFVADAKADQIQVIDLETDEVTQTIDLPKPAQPEKLYLHEPSQQLFIMNAVGKNISVLQLNTLTLREPLLLDFSPKDMQLTSSGQLIITGNQNIATLTLDALSLETEKEIENLYPLHADYWPERNQILMPNQQNVYLLNLSDRSMEIWSFGQKVDWVKVIQDKVVLGYENQLRIEDLNTRTPLASVQLDGNIASLKNSKGNLVVVTRAPGELQVRELKNLNMIQTIPIGGHPVDLFEAVF